MKQEITFEQCNISDINHRNALIELMNHYMQDPMGDSEPLDKAKQNELIDLFAKQTNAKTLFIKVNDSYAGLVNYFYLFSTFKAKPYIYIHDVIVNNTFRGNGLGRKMIEKIIEIAKEENCCKIMLEVREDNAPALSLYNDLGFIDCEPKNYSWTKIL